MPEQTRFIVFPNYQHAGLSNQLLELEIKVGLALLSDRILVTPDRICIWSSDEPLQERVDTSRPKLLDLLDIPVPHMTIEQLDQHAVRTRIQANWAGDGTLESFLCYPGPASFTERTRANFRDWRPHCWQFPHPRSDAARADAWIIPKRTLANFGYFFLTDRESGARLRGAMRAIRPKASYEALGRSVAAQLGTFNAVHIRRGDFTQWWVRCPTVGEILANISQIMPSDQPLLICTDGMDEREFFAPIRQRYPGAIFADDLINGDFGEAFSGLPVADGRARALLTQIIAAQSRVFAGTLFSTFTLTIHRMRGFADPARPILFVFNPFDPIETPMRDCEFTPVKDGEFSWNRFVFRMPAQATAWFREWPESYREGA